MALLWYDGFDNYAPGGTNVVAQLREAGYYMALPFGGDTNPTVVDFTRRGYGLALQPNSLHYNGGPVVQFSAAKPQLYVGFAYCIATELVDGYTPQTFTVFDFRIDIERDGTYDNGGVGQSSELGVLIVNPDLSLTFTNYSGQSISTGAGVAIITPNLWQYIEIGFDTTNRQVTIKVDGLVQLQGAWTSVAPNCVCLNAGPGAAWGPFYDDLYICDGTGTSFNSYLGTIVVHGITPSADGNASNVNSSTAGMTATQVVDYNSPGGTVASFVTGGNIGDTVLFAPNTFPDDIIDVLAVAVVATFDGVVNGNTPFNMGLSLNGDTAFVGAVQACNPTPTTDPARTQTIATQIWTAQPLGGPWETQTAQATQFGVEFASASATTFTQVVMSILATYSPDFGFIDMIVDDVFPNDISYDSVGSTRFATDVTVVDSGADQRVQRWSQPLMEYDVAYGVRTMEQLLALISFFRAMKGRVTCFNYLDHVDNTSSIPVAYEARSAPQITPFDQTIFVTNGLLKTFQLTKTYATATQSQVRPIFRPVPGTVRVGINGTEVHNFTVTGQGQITFSSPATAITVAHGSIPTGNGDNTVITGSPGDFSALIPYVSGGWTVSVAGFTNALNNLSYSQFCTLAAVAGDGSSVTVGYPHSHTTTAETSTGQVTISVNPAPPNNASITAGYQFYVPVRFDTDSLPISLQEYGVGGANSVKLIEVRPSSW